MIRAALFALGVAFAGAAAYGLRGLAQSAPSAALALGLFVIAPALSASCVLAGLRGSARTQRRVLLTVAMALTSLYVVEVVLPVSNRVAALRWLAERGASPVDRRDKSEVIRAATREGAAAVSVVQPKSFLEWQADGTMRSSMTDDGAELHPLSGLAHRPSVMCNEMGEWITWTSDRYGMNNSDEVWDADSAEVALVGDAFTNGWCAPRDEHFVGLITDDEMGPVVNLGQSGNGPLLTLASLLEYASELRPRIVLWFHYELNEFSDLEVERRSPLLMGYLDGSTHQQLIERHDAIEREVTLRLADSLHWAGLGKLVVDEVSLVPDPEDVRAFVKLTHLRSALGATYWNPPEADHELWSSVLERANDVVTSWGGRLMVVYLPAALRYENTEAREDAERTAARVLADLDVLGIPWIDPTPGFDAREKPAHLFNPIEAGGRGHYTEEAHRIVAESVVEALDGNRE